MMSESEFLNNLFKSDLKAPVTLEALMHMRAESSAGFKSMTAELGEVGIRLGNLDFRLGQSEQYRSKANATIEEIAFNVSKLIAGQDQHGLKIDRLEARAGGVETRLERVEMRLERVEARLDVLETQMIAIEAKVGRLEEAMNAGFEAFESKFEALESKFEALESKFEALETKFEALESKFEAMESKLDRVLKKLDA